MGLNKKAQVEEVIEIVKDPEAKVIPRLPDDDYHTLVTLCVLVLMAVFFWLYVLSVKYKRRQEPGYVPKLLRAGFMQRFQFVQRLRDAEH